MSLDCRSWSCCLPNEVSSTWAHPFGFFFGPPGPFLLHLASHMSFRSLSGASQQPLSSLSAASQEPPAVAHYIQILEVN